MIKETLSPVQKAGTQMSQEEKSWFSHSQMIANIMSARMKELGMTQKMLAEKMNCTQQYISKILKGRENLSLEAISKIEKALDIHFLQMPANE
jgi:ribosome-binding protein aMBF1 (putative translation factor)